MIPTPSRALGFLSRWRHRVLAAVGVAARAFVDDGDGDGNRYSTPVELSLARQLGSGLRWPTPEWPRGKGKRF